jgi:hypothetical protein
MTTPPLFQVHTSGPRTHYVQEVATGELKTGTFKTHRAAQAAVAEWNRRRLTVVR